MLIVAGAVLGLLGGAATGLGVGIIWTELISSARDNGGVVFFELVPLGALLGALGGGVTFGVIAMRDSELQIEPPLGEHD